jgi:hypothetical protein
MLGKRSALIVVAALTSLLLAPELSVAGGGATVGWHNVGSHGARLRWRPAWGLRALAPRAAYTEYPYPGYNLFPYGPYPYDYNPYRHYPYGYYFDGRYGCSLTYWGC